MVIKARLRELGWAYAELAARIGVSEVSVKRWLTADDLSLARIGRIAAAMGTTGFALLLAAATGEDRTFVLDAATEQYLADHPLDHAIWAILHRGLPAEEVRAHHGLDAAPWRRILSRLEVHGLVEVHPTDRLRLCHRGVHDWLPGGPLAQATLAWRTRRLSRWLAGEATVQASDRRMSAASALVARDELLELAQRWRDRAWRDEHVVDRVDQRGVSWCLVLADSDVFVPVMECSVTGPAPHNGGAR